MDFLLHMIVDFIFAVIGWLCLSVRYWDRDKIQKIKDEQYCGEFSIAGRALILSFIALTGAAVIFGCVAFAVIHALYKWLQII